MAQLNFPDNPIDGQLYPNPCPVGVTQYRWESSTNIWRIVGVATGVTPGTYGDDVTVGQFTVNVTGEITQARNVPIRLASTVSPGIVQLLDSTDSLSVSRALTARAGKYLQDQIGNLANCIVPDHTNVVAALNDLQQQSTNLQTNALIWCGYYNAEEGDISFVSVAGQRLGYVIGQELPTPSTSNGGDFFIVNKSGNPRVAGDANAPDSFVEVGNWLLSEAVVWVEVNARGGKIMAADVGYVPTFPLTANNVQNAIYQITQFFRTGIGGCTISSTRPNNPYPGQLWWDSDDGLFYVFYQDSNSAQWVEAGGGGSQGLGAAGGGTVYEIRTGRGLNGGPITTEGEIYLEPAFVDSNDFSRSVIGGVIPRQGLNYSNTTGIVDVRLSGDFTGKDPNTAFTQEGANILNAKIDAIGGGNVLAGTYDARLGQLVYVTPAGLNKGFVQGQNLPAPSPAIDNYYVIVTIGGNVGPEGPQASNPGDWYICQADGPQAVWFLIDYEVASTTASNVSVIPIPGIATAGNVQAALEEIEIQVQDRIEFAEATTDGLQIRVSDVKPDSNDGTTLSIGLDYASINDRGIVQLTNDVTGNSQTLAVTQYAANLLDKKIDALVGTNVLAGTYNSNTGTVASVTPAGQKAGFIVGQQAPAARLVPDNYFLIVIISGGYGPPGATIPSAGVQSGDWFVNENEDGTAAWITIDFENTAIAAVNVSLAPVPGLSATNVQKGIEQLAANASRGVVDVNSTNDGITVTLTPDGSGLGTDAALTLNPATEFDIGGVYVPNTTDVGLNLNASGGLSLRVASPTLLGGVKVGKNLTIDVDGTLNAQGGGGGEAEIQSIDSISSQFDGTTRTFDLQVSGTPLAASVTTNYTIISVGGILQSPGNSYTVSASKITFTEPPPAGSGFSGRAIVSIPQTGGGAGGVQSIEFLAPLTGGVITETGSVGITDASPTQRGVMTAAYATKLEAIGSNGNGTRYVSTETPTPTAGNDGDIWYQV